MSESCAARPGLVTTVIPVYNRSGKLLEATACVLAQTYRPIEIIIVDDGSTDATASVADGLANAHQDVVRAIHQENRGPGLAREAGRLIARGEFIQYLDSDDLLEPLKFEIQVAALRQQPDSDIAYCKTREIGPGAVADVPVARTGEQISRIFPAILAGRLWYTPTPLFRRNVVDRAGPWTDLRQEEDWEYDARLGLLGCRLVWQSEWLATVRHHDASRSGGNSLGNPVKMRWRAEAHRLIYGHARRYTVTTNDPHMKHFARELFLLARQCGASGLPAEARQLFELAREASTPERRDAWDFRIYAAMAATVGWRLTGRLACWTDRFRARGQALP